MFGLRDGLPTAAVWCVCNKQWNNIRLTGKLTNQVNAGHGGADNHRDEGNDNHGDVNDLEGRRERLSKEQHVNRARQDRRHENGREVAK